MNKSQGTTVGAMLLAALLARSTTPGVPTFQSSSAGASTKSELQGQPTSGDGPWVASCEYWAPERLVPDTSADLPSIGVALKENNHGLNGTLSTLQEDQTDCKDEPNKWGIPSAVPSAGKNTKPKTIAVRKDESNKWGIPSAVPSAGQNAKPKIIAIIATVPDPIQTNMALQFDRTIDALIDAAEDNGYVSSYYWLPWQQEREKSKDDGDASNANRSYEEREPGLIIFKHVPTQGLPTDDDFRSSLYLFLVGETPTSGINGYQMERVFQYENEFRNDKDVDFYSSTNKKKDLDRLAIIGPNYSGSAASLRRAIDFQLASHRDINSVDVRGTTSTLVSVNQMNHGPPSPSSSSPSEICSGQHQKVCYESFENNSKYDQDQLDSLITGSGVPMNRIAVLIEDDTTLGQWSAERLELKPTGGQASTKPVQGSENESPIVIRYPRQISLLRNAQSAQHTTGTTPSPYLHLSLKGSNSYDSVPHLSGELAPLSQEAQLMAIQHQLQRYRANYIVITATDVLDALFLAQFLHRAIPDARLVFDGGDLLFEREIDDVPFIGAVTISAYHLIGLGNSFTPGYGGRAFPDSSSEEYYNAASYTLWDKSKLATLRLAGYQNISRSPNTDVRPPLWVTVIGSDGYYPLGIASKNSSDNPQILPEIADPGKPSDHLGIRTASPKKLPLHPSLAWYFLCLFVFLLCLAHTAVLWVADYWSPFTRDLDIAQNDQPHRRSMYINIGTIFLFCMAFLTTWPLIPCLKMIAFDWPSFITGGLTFLAGLIVIVTTLGKTWPYRLTPSTVQDHFYYNSFNLLAVLTGLVLIALWIVICFTGRTGGPKAFAGLFFAYRCLNPTSKVSPIVPIVLLLFSWYLWAIFQNLRLRFSQCNRPVLPRKFNGGTSYPLYVSDDELNECQNFQYGCLYSNITCLLITREVLQRFFRKRVDNFLRAFYIFLFFLSAFCLYVRSVDRIVWHLGRLPTPYEFLITGLFFPLLVIAVAGWLRMLFIWGSLKRGLLQMLENLPIRFAFDRIKNAGWISMFRQSGVREQWRDMARSTESMRQLIHEPKLLDHAYPSPHELGTPSDRNPLIDIYQKLDSEIAALLNNLGDGEKGSVPALPCDNSGEFGSSPARDGINHMHAIELLYAEFADELLKKVLLPYWTKHRTGLVESEEASTHHARNAPSNLDDSPEPTSCNDDPPYIHVAEEFLVIRYVSLIRAVIVNLRYLMIFISMTFVLATIAWNSYPFQPRQVIDWIFTILLIFLGCGVVGVFAQMYRDPILSRITHTTPNQLGLDFYIRIVSFGAIPVLTWLAYNFPDIGGTLFKLLQPGVEVMK